MLVSLSHRLDDQDLIPSRGRGVFTTASRLALGPTQPPVQGIPGAHYQGIKWQRHEADHSLPSSDKPVFLFK